MLHSSIARLDRDEAARRLAEICPNSLPPLKRRSWWRRFLAQFKNLVIYVLLAAAVVTAAIGEWEDALVILGVVVINAVVGFIQEGKAEAALDAIRSLLSAKATVVRGGRRLELAVEDLVPGDVVFLQPGDRVPADVRLIDAAGLRCDEAVLTGESLPADKDPASASESADLGDRRSMAYFGTLARSGQGIGVVIATGGNTEIGRIGGLLEAVQSVDTPLTASSTCSQGSSPWRWSGSPVRSWPLACSFTAIRRAICSWPPSASRWRPSPRACRRS